jgi:hypothetical protein
MTCVYHNVCMTLYIVFSGANDTNDYSSITGTNGDSSSSSDNRNAVTLQDLKLAMVDLKQQALQLEQASTSSKDFESGDFQLMQMCVYIYCFQYLLCTAMDCKLSIAF